MKQYFKKINNENVSTYMFMLFPLLPIAWWIMILIALFKI